MVHEAKNPSTLLEEIHEAQKPGGKLLLAEPAGHVRVEAFEATLRQAEAAGFMVESRPDIRRSHAAVLVRR